MKSPKSKKTAEKSKNSTRKPTRRDISRAIDELDVSSLHSDAITDVMLHCASALQLRKAMADTKTLKAKTSGYCYTKAGDSSTVSIWSNGFKVGETSESDAQAHGIPPCG